MSYPRRRIRADRVFTWSANGRLTVARDFLRDEPDGTIRAIRIRGDFTVTVAGGDTVANPDRLLPQIISRVRLTDADGLLVDASGHAIGAMMNLDLPRSDRYWNRGTVLAAGAGQAITAEWVIPYENLHPVDDDGQPDRLETGLRLRDFARGGNFEISLAAAAVGTIAADRMTVTAGSIEVWFEVENRLADGYRRTVYESRQYTDTSDSVTVSGIFEHILLSVGGVGLTNGSVFAAADTVICDSLGLSTLHTVDFLRDEHTRLWGAKAALTQALDGVELLRLWRWGGRMGAKCKESDLPRLGSIVYQNSSFAVVAANLPEFVLKYYGGANCKGSVRLGDGSMIGRGEIVAAATPAIGNDQAKLLAAALPTAA